jgi:hypothetical protein
MPLRKLKRQDLRNGRLTKARETPRTDGTRGAGGAPNPFRPFFRDRYPVKVSICENFLITKILVPYSDKKLSPEKRFRDHEVLMRLFACQIRKFTDSAPLAAPPRSGRAVHASPSFKLRGRPIQRIAYQDTARARRWTTMHLIRCTTIHHRRKYRRRAGTLQGYA